MQPPQPIRAQSEKPNVHIFVELLTSVEKMDSCGELSLEKIQSHNGESTFRDQLGVTEQNFEIGYSKLAVLCPLSR